MKKLDTQPPEVVQTQESKKEKLKSAPTPRPPARA